MNDERIISPMTHAPTLWVLVALVFVNGKVLPTGKRSSAVTVESVLYKKKKENNSHRHNNNHDNDNNYINKNTKQKFTQNPHKYRHAT